jgi:hypothetical protein
MEPAFTGAALKPTAKKTDQRWERLLAAPMLFLAWAALAGCGASGAPVIHSRLRIGLGATAMALGPDQSTLAIACHRSNDVWFLDMDQKGADLGRIDTGSRPRALLFNGDKPSFFVAEGVSPNASVALIKRSDQRVARRYQPRGLLSHWLELHAENRLLAARLGEPLLAVYRLKDWHLVKAVPVGGEVTALAADKDHWWATTRQADSLARLSPRDLSLQAVALAGPEPRGLVLDSGQGLAYVACQGRLGEAVPLALPSPTPPDSGLSPLTPSAESDDIEAGENTDATDNSADEEDAADESVSAQAGPDRFAGGGLAVFRLDDTRRLDYAEVPGGPTYLALSKDGLRVALACADGQLRIFDLAARKVVYTLRLGGVPGAMLLSPNGRQLWVALNNVKQLVVVDPGQGW